MPLLICEGACNPTLHTFDSVAEFYAYGVIGANVGRRKPEAVTLLDIVITERKKLRHTSHTHVAGNRWACGTCGAERKYGAALDVPEQSTGAWWQTASQRANRRAS